MKKKLLIGLTCLMLVFLVMPMAADAQRGGEDTFGVEAVEEGLDGSLTEAEPREVAARIINVALGFLGIIAVVLVLYGGFMWMTAAGNEERVTKAKQILTAALIGLVIIIMAWGLTRFVMDELMRVTAG